GCSTGISAGFAPRRTLFTTSAARLHMFGQYGPKEIRPPMSTGSRTVYIVGSRAVSAKILMRIRFTKKIGLAGTYNACARPWSASKAAAISSARRISNVAVSSAKARAAPWTSSISNEWTDIGQDRQTAQIGNKVAQKFDSLTGCIGCLARQAADVSARSRETCHYASTNRIARCRENDWNHRCRLLGSQRGRGIVCEYQIDLQPDELRRDLGKSLIAPLAPAILYSK